MKRKILCLMFTSAAPANHRGAPGDRFFLTPHYGKDASETMVLRLYSNGFSLFDKGTGAGDYVQQ